MNRKILLVEPNYKNKYPPMGLMKLSTYYKMQGDQVTFFKGNLIELVLNDTYELLLEQLYANDQEVFWEKYKPQICNYLKKGYKSYLEEIPKTQDNIIIKQLLKYYRKYFYNKEYFLPENRKYDKVGVTTLFTFYWDITIDTINFVKKLCKSETDVMVGGVMGTILPDRVEQATGILPYVGTISTPGVLDDNDIIVDTLPLDYSILEEIEYEYPASNAYYAYMTRGCVNRCKFCAVPKLEPEYKSYSPISEQIQLATSHFGGKKDLLLLDNNVLASCRFNQIIDEIKQSGFKKDSKFVQPNVFEIAVRNLKSGYNDKGYLRSIVKQYRALIQKYGAGEIQSVYDLLEENNLLNFHTANKNAVFETYDSVKDLFEEFYNRKPLKRYVDFNQGIDARLITEDKMEKMSEIPIKPLRIAFDSWELSDIYTAAVKTAVRCGHKNLSNYLLYNYEDTPIDLYQRLKLNVELCEELDANIYSFPMKYHPIEDPNYFSNRDYIGRHWNRKFIRTIQAILNSTKGKVGKGRSFFEKAFGSNIDEFYKLLYMPEVMIIYRLYFERLGLTDEWWNKFSLLSSEKKDILRPIIHKNEFTDINKLTSDSDILEVLKFYTIKRKDAEKALNIE